MNDEETTTVETPTYVAAPYGRPRGFDCLEWAHATAVTLSLKEPGELWAVRSYPGGQLCSLAVDGILFRPAEEKTS